MLQPVTAGGLMPGVNTAPGTHEAFGSVVLEVGEIVLSITDNASVRRAAAGTVGYVQRWLERKVRDLWVLFITSISERLHVN